ncbi:MAG: thymidine phosphorylase [Myxococcota bacterium]
MRAADVIRRKRDGLALEPTEIRELIGGFTAGEVADAQMSAFCMAVFFQGLSDDESAALVDAMLHSGDVLDLASVPGLKIDKHSTGGVGDKISLCLAPLVAACGVPVPMISGRGLGHTGGTLDKLAAIPGFRSDLSPERFVALVAERGMALGGQTDSLAPADRRLYALRDVTGTVESIPLIASSIMSKKLAEGIDGLVLDVKVGSGAFMKTLEAGRALAQTLVDIAVRAEKRCSALLTNMDQVLGQAVGNALETREAVDVLRNEGPADVRELTLLLGIEMLRLGDVEIDPSLARVRLEAALADGSALERFRSIVAAQGGEPRALEPGGLPEAPDRDTLTFDRPGWVEAVDVEAVGRAAMLLGAGRSRAEDAIDPAVGLIMKATVGDQVEPGQVLAEIHHRESRGLAAARKALAGAFRVGETSRRPSPLLLAPPLRDGTEADSEVNR